MRRAGLTLSALLAAAPVAYPQAPTPPPGGAVPMNLAPINPQQPAPVAALPPALLGHLKAWEEKHKQVNTLYTECELVTKDLLRRTEKVSTGTIMCMKPNLAWLRIESKSNKADWQAYISNGNSVFEYESDKKHVVEHRIPKSNPNSVGDNLLMEFMSGAMTAADVIKRFDLTLDKEEEYYVHIKVKPRLARDLQEFESLTLVLFGPKTAHLKQDYLPAVVVMKSNNGQTESTWSFKQPRVNVPNITAAHFQYVKPPDGWQFKPDMAKNQPDPRVVRPAGGNR